MARSKESLKLSLKRWQAKQKQTPNRFYFYYAIFILCFAYIINELAKNINNILETEVINTFFNTGSAQDNFAFYTILLTLLSAISIFSFIYKTLADKFGRKPFLVINTIGMGVGMFICFVANHLVVYSVGLVLVYFFVPCDIQVVYVLETASDKHRSFWLAFYKAIAVISVAIVSPLRSWAIGLGYWQLAFLIPAIIGVVTGIVILFFLRESHAFVDSKIKHLKKAIRDYDRPVKPKKTVKDAEGGIIPAIKYMFANKRLIWLFFIGVIFAICTIGNNNFALILVQNEILDEAVTVILFVYPFVTALVEIVAGILSDKFGRKKASLFTGFLTLIGFLYFIVGIKSNWYPLVSGLCLGLFTGGYLSSIDLFNVMSAEQSPTNLRSSLLSIMGVSLSVGSFVGTGIMLLFNMVNPYMDLGFFCIVLIVPTMTTGLLILLSQIPETKAINLEEIGEEKKGKKDDDDIKETHIKL